MRLFQLLPHALLAVILLLALPGPASAVTIGGVEFTNWTSIEATPGANLELTTDGDIYVYAPGSIDFDNALLTAFAFNFVDAQLNVNDPLICESGCSTDVYNLTGDVVLSIFGVLGDLTLTTTASMVFDKTVVPEPSTALLLVAGLTLVPGWGRRRALRRVPV